MQLVVRSIGEEVAAMNYQHKLIDGQWRITANGEVMDKVYASGIDVARALSKLRQGYTATTVATLTRKQEAAAERRETFGK